MDKQIHLSWDNPAGDSFITYLSVGTDFSFEFEDFHSLPLTDNKVATLIPTGFLPAP